MVPSPRPGLVEIGQGLEEAQAWNASQERAPEIVVHIDMYHTSVYVLDAVRMAIRELNEVYGITVSYEISNETLFGLYHNPYNSVIIEIIGKTIEIPDYDYNNDDINEYIRKIKNEIILEILKSIGNSERESWDRAPYGNPGMPSAPEAVMLA